MSTYQMGLYTWPIDPSNCIIASISSPMKINMSKELCSREHIPNRRKLMLEYCWRMMVVKIGRETEAATFHMLSLLKL